VPYIFSCDFPKVAAINLKITHGLDYVSIATSLQYKKISLKFLKDEQYLFVNCHNALFVANMFRKNNKYPHWGYCPTKYQHQQKLQMITRMNIN
jgi:hypothetical protein